MNLSGTWTIVTVAVLAAFGGRARMALGVGVAKLPRVDSRDPPPS